MQMSRLPFDTFFEPTQYVWPWSYNKCGAIDHLDEKQEVNACINEPGFGLHQHQGRGAPEIGKNTTLSVLTTCSS